MDLTSNRSGLWRHMLAELVVGWEDYVANIQTMSRDMIKLQLSQQFCHATKIFFRATWVSCRVEVTLCCDFYTFRSCNTGTFSLTTLQCCDMRQILLLSSGILQSNYYMKQPDLYYFETIKMTSQAWSKFTENTRLWLVFPIQNLTRLLTSFLWSQNSIDQAVS